MSLENSQYTFASLLLAGKGAFRKEVDRIIKEADNEEEAIPAKRGRYAAARSPENGIGTQTILRRQSRGVSGTIIEVILENFLCHENLSVKLNPQITFVVGRNGSGKSAVLTGIMVALGGNASTTGRGQALKDFIKTGCNSARVTCIINNSGPLNYKREEYGDQIVVVRTLQQQGGSSIKLKSERGKVISTKMEELRNMTLTLAIQVDNPISVLDQNMARHFLVQSRPSTKFELFLRATNLDSLKDIFIKIAFAVTKAKQDVGKKERELIENNTEVEEARRRHNMLENLEKDRVKLVSLKMESLWAQARDSRTDLDRGKRKLKKVVEEKDRLNSVLSSEENTEPILQQIESSKTDARALEDQQKEIENELKELSIKLTASKQNIKKWREDKKVLENHLKMDENSIADYKKEIQAQEAKMLPEHIDKRRKQKEQIQELQSLLQKWKADRENKMGELSALQNNLNGVNEGVEQLRSTKRRHEEDLRNLRNQLQGLEANDSNLALFGACMPELVRQIEANARRFKKKPVGPLGSYVKVKDPKWAYAVESVIRNRLTSFVVDNVDDEKLLQDIMKRVWRGERPPKPSIIRSPFASNAFDTSQTAARSSEYSNVQDMIEVSNVVAFNMLIDWCSIESTLLIPTDNECFSLLSDLRSVPRNCGKAYTLQADQYYPAPNYRTYSSNDRSGKAQVLQTSRNDIIRDTKQRIDDLESAIPSVTQNVSHALNNVKGIHEQIKDTKAAITRINEQFMETQGKLEQLRDEEQPDVNTISGLREELAEKERVFQERNARLAELPAEADIMKKNWEAIVEKGKELDAKVKAIRNEKEELLQQQKALREQLDEFQSAQMGKKKKIEQLCKQETEISQECSKLEDTCNKLQADAEKYHTHVESDTQDFVSMKNTKRELRDVDRELRTLEKRLASVEKTLGQNAETIQQDFHSKLQAYNQTKKYIKLLKNNSKYLEYALDQRKKLYHTQKNLMCAVTSHQFTRVLRYRNCNGKVTVDFEKKELHIEVHPVDEGEKAGLGTSSLSGGERSYATMAFVIALWNVTELPFYFLDEFDVFMDCLNRQTVLTLLLRFAKQKLGYQFGFLTPLDTTSIDASDSRVSIYKLKDPVRSQDDT